MKPTSVKAMVCIITLGCAAAAHAQITGPAYPSRPVRVIVPYAPGGASDFTARELSQKLTESMGQQFVVDNRPGAGSTVGHGIAARATPDGYTLLLGTPAGLVLNPLLDSKVSYDVARDFAPIGLAVFSPFALSVNNAVPATSLRELIGLAKGQAGKLAFSSPGFGSPSHMGSELLMAMSGTRMVHVPYKGNGPALIDIIGGQVQLGFVGVAEVAPPYRAGRVKLLGVGHPTRVRAVPEVPAVAETLPGFDNTTWFGLLAPAGTPRAIVSRLNAEMNRILTVPEYAQKLLAQGVETTTSTPESMADRMRADVERWRKVIREAAIKF